MEYKCMEYISSITCDAIQGVSEFNVKPKGDDSIDHNYLKKLKKKIFM